MRQPPTIRRDGVAAAVWGHVHRHCAFAGNFCQILPAPAHERRPVGHASTDDQWLVRAHILPGGGSAGWGFEVLNSIFSQSRYTCNLIMYAPTGAQATPRHPEAWGVMKAVAAAVAAPPGRCRAR